MADITAILLIQSIILIQPVACLARMVAITRATAMAGGAISRMALSITRSIAIIPRILLPILTTRPDIHIPIQVMSTAPDIAPIALLHRIRHTATPRVCATPIRPTR